MYTHEMIIEACIKISRDAEFTDTIEIVAEMNRAAWMMLEMPTIFDKRIAEAE